MCACIRLAWALVLRSCSQWPNIVGAVEVLEEDEGVLDLAVDENVFGFLRYCVLGASNFHQEVQTVCLDLTTATLLLNHPSSVKMKVKILETQ